ncbi:MAG: LpxI family protein, partial [Candidatus Omnitrophota bacterium]|nr:LpxI family protein [Candidatus Omnitrophota bacterium]
MARIGLIAGAGKLPLEFIRSAKGQGLKVVVFAIQGMGSLQL